MKIRKSRPEDLERMLQLYADARVFMAEHGNPTQWTNGYPEPEMLQEDIRAGVSYVCEDDQGRVVGTFVFFVGEDESYKVIEQGDWKDHRVPYGVVHRITSQRGEDAPRVWGASACSGALNSAAMCASIPIGTICPCRAPWRKTALNAAESSMSGAGRSGSPSRKLPVPDGWK